MNISKFSIRDIYRQRELRKNKDTNFFIKIIIMLMSVIFTNRFIYMQDRAEDRCRNNNNNEI